MGVYWEYLRALLGSILGRPFFGGEKLENKIKGQEDQIEP
jgi:hypothetical protein